MFPVYKTYFLLAVHVPLILAMGVKVKACLRQNGSPSTKQSPRLGPRSLAKKPSRPMERAFPAKRPKSLRIPFSAERRDWPTAPASLAKAARLVLLYAWLVDSPSAASGS